MPEKDDPTHFVSDYNLKFEEILNKSCKKFGIEIEDSQHGSDHPNEMYYDAVVKASSKKDVKDWLVSLKSSRDEINEEN